MPHADFCQVRWKHQAIGQQSQQNDSIYGILYFVVTCFRSLLTTEWNTYAARNWWKDGTNRYGRLKINETDFLIMTSSLVQANNYLGRMPQSGKLPVLNLLTGQKSGFSPRRGNSLHRFMSNLAGTMGTSLRLAVQNFTSIATGGGNAAPKMSKISTFW